MLRTSVGARYRVSRRTVRWFIIPIFLFSCFYVFTFVFSDRYDLFVLSYLVGLLSLLVVFRFRGPTTVIGFLVTLFAARYYFFPLLVKTAEGQPIWHNLHSPTETLFVLVFSLLAMVVASMFYCEKATISGGALTSPQLVHLRRLVVATALLGIAAILQSAMSQQYGQGAEFSAGFLGGAGSIFKLLLAFSLSLAIYGALTRGRSVWRSHGVILLLAINLLFSFISVSRSSVLIILVAVVVPYAFARRRINIYAVGAGLICVLLFTFVMSPTIIYLRSENLGSTEFYSLGQRIERMSEFWVETISDPASITEYRTAVSGSGHYIDYFEGYYGGLERFAILPDNDRLINGTTSSNYYGGWRTLVWAASMVPPRFVYPDKPFLGPGAYLGHIAGLSAAGDNTTQWAFGFPSELYHAFSYAGVFFGTIAILSLFSMVVKLFELFGVFPAWKMLIVVYYWNSFSEGSLAGILSSLVPLVVLVVILDRLVRYTKRWRFVSGTGAHLRV